MSLCLCLWMCVSLIHKHTQVIYRTTVYPSVHQSPSQPLHPHLMFSSVQSLSRVRLLVTPWIAARQASLSITISQSSLKPTSIESVMPSSHLILCRPLLLLPPNPPSIRVFSNESTLRMRWPKYWSFITIYYTESSETVQENGMVWLFNR